MVCRYDYINYQRCFYSISDNDFKIAICTINAILVWRRQTAGAQPPRGSTPARRSHARGAKHARQRLAAPYWGRVGLSLAAARWATLVSLAVVVEGLARREGYVCTTNKLFVPRWFISASLVIVIPTTTALTSIIPIHYLRQFKKSHYIYKN